MKRRQFVSALVVGLIALGVGAVVLAVPGHHSTRATAPPSAAAYMPVPGSGEGEQFGAMDTYWNDRLTYPTGHFNPAWLRAAKTQDARVASRRPRFGGRGSGLLDGSGPEAGEDDRLYGLLRLRLHRGPHQRDGRRSDDDHAGLDRRVRSHGRRRGLEDDQLLQQLHPWSVTTDDPLISTLAIDTLNIDPNDHNTVYAGTGDLNYGSFSMGSQGILKSTDAGAHWTVLGEDVFGPAYTEPAGQFPQYDAVGKVRVDPNNSQKVLAGTKKGMFISYNGGTNWTGPCSTNSFPTQRQDITGLELTDMGSGTTRIIAAVGVRGFATTVQYDLGNNGANGLYSANVPSSGCPSFTSIASNANGFVYGTAISGSPYTTGAAMNAGSGTPYSNPTTGDQLGRIDIAVAPSNPNVIYAQVQSIAANTGGCGGAAGCQLGVWQTNNGGTSWTYMAGSQGPRARQRRLRLRLPAELVRPGARGRPEQRRPPLHRHV